METDTALFEIFESNPDRFEELTDLPLPEFKSAKSQTLKKTLQVTCDLLFEPVSKAAPHWIAELQMYFDHSIFNRADLARAMVWKSLNKSSDCLRMGYQPREVKGIVIFGDRTLLPGNLDRHSSIEFLFLDELIEKLRTRNPDSPLLAVLAPLIVDDNQLEKQASTYYNAIRSNPNLKDDERKVLSNVFIHFISQRFKHFDSQQFQTMLAKLTPIEETCVGKELIEKGIRTGIEKGIKAGIEKGIEKSTIAIKMILAGKVDQEIADLTELPLKTIQDMRKNLESPED